MWCSAQAFGLHAPDHISLIRYTGWDETTLYLFTTVEPGCQAPMLIGKRAASWMFHIQGSLQKLTTLINFMMSRTPSARARMDSFN